MRSEPLEIKSKREKKCFVRGRGRENNLYQQQSEKEYWGQVAAFSEKRMLIPVKRIY